MARVVDGVKLASGLYLADITDAVGVAAFDYRTGAVPEFTFDAVDRDRKLSARGLLREGTTLKYEADTWQIAAVERTYKGRRHLADVHGAVAAGAAAAEHDRPEDMGEGNA